MGSSNYYTLNLSAPEYSLSCQFDLVEIWTRFNFLLSFWLNNEPGSIFAFILLGIWCWFNQDQLSSFLTRLQKSACSWLRLEPGSRFSPIITFKPGSIRFSLVQTQPGSSPAHKKLGCTQICSFDPKQWVEVGFQPCLNTIYRGGPQW